jgi:hypothetical protein
MSEPAKVFEDRELPGQWRVEWFGDDGRCELQTFTGPTARREALRYAMQNYTHFREVEPATHKTHRPARCSAVRAQTHRGTLAWSPPSRPSH